MKLHTTDPGRAIHRSRGDDSIVKVFVKTLRGALDEHGDLQDALPESTLSQPVLLQSALSPSSLSQSVRSQFPQPQTSLAERFMATDVPSLVDDLVIQPGTFADYKRLAQFHYRGQRPGAVTSVLRMVRRGPSVVGRFLRRGAETQVVGVLVRSLPQLSCRLRDVATGNRYRLLCQRDAAVMLNREVRTISRVVIDPCWRGLGLAVKLVRAALQQPEQDCEAPLTEALAAMGRVSPFFEHAGMRRYDRPPGPAQSRLIDALRLLGLEPSALASVATVEQIVSTGDPQSAQFLLRELQRWQRGAHRTAGLVVRGMTLRELLVAARNQLLSQPVYYLHRREDRDAAAADRQS